MTARVLIVEDERDLAAIMLDYVRAAGYAATTVADGNAALAAARAGAADLLVLDIMLPGLDGLAVCAAVRAFSDLPIILVTAKVEEIDRLLGLETGADDYVCKPFSPRELVARIKALLRRARPAAERTSPIEIDEAAHSVRVLGHALDLTRTEFDLLAAMAKRPGTIFSRAQLLDIANRDNLDVADRAVDTHIKNLRRKLAQAAPEAEMIRSIYGLGYRLDL
jgi:two-component system response regulator BaeR